MNKLDILAEKIEQMITKLEKLEKENSELLAENSKLKNDLHVYRKEYDSFKLNNVDKTESVKTKLTTILNRLEQLEEIAS